MLHIPNAGTSDYREGDKIGPSRWSYYDLLVAVRGKIFLDIKGRPFHLNQGDAVLIPPDSPFRGQITSSTATIWVLHFYGYAPIASSSGFVKRRTAFPIRKAFSDLFYRQCTEKLDEIYNGRPSSHRNAMLRNLAALILGHVEGLSCSHGKSSDESRPFDELLAWARKNLSTVQTRSLAHKAGLSDSHFRAVFQKFYRISPSRMLKDFRLQEARRLLRQSNHSIKEIGRMLGYSDAVSFHRAFKGAGATPAKYRSERLHIV
jgi:AraC-like DNA-binding protein